MSTDSPSPLVRYYHHLREQLFSATQDGKEQLPALTQLVADAKERSTELSELTREEIDAVAGYLQRDLEAAGSFLAETGDDLSRWFHMEETLIEDRLKSLFTQLADPTRIALDRLNAEARASQILRQGEVLGMGKIICTLCGHSQQFNEAGIIQACPECGATTFRRPDEELTGGAETAEDLNKTTSSSPITELDQLFFGIMEQLALQARDHAAESARHILKLSKGYLSEKAGKAMEDFHRIYFSDNDLIEQRKIEVNKDVDDIFDEVQSIMESGGDLSQLDHIQEDEELRDARLGLSGIQKQLESIIRLEEGIRVKLMPVMVSMQFEDAMNQRLDHIVSGWAMISQALGNDTVDIDELAEQVGQLTTAIEETELYYHEVLNREPPSERLTEDNFMLDLF